MTRVRAPEGDAVLLSWVSVGAGAAPLLAALEHPSPLFGKITKLYLCWRDAPNADDRAAVDATIEALRGPHMPEVIPLPWATKAQPTDHAAIQPFAEQALTRVRSENPGAHVYVQLSPGTPAMHAIWLVLCSTGVVDGPLTMIQSIPASKRGPKASAIMAVPVEVDTWLRRFRSARPRTADSDDDGRSWNPGDFVDGSKMRSVLLQLREWADLRAPVLLLGERGTGKSTLANFLRAIGPYQRATKGSSTEWPSAVCGQFRGNPQMARSELFGYRKGAFTGADEDRPGLVEQADGDCLFLDEIADLDRDTQRLLMAALEGRGFHRLGDPTRRHVGFRLICATNRPLDELVGGLLDADFYDRIGVFTVRVPPLRECREDLPVFWRDVLRRVANSSGVELAGLEELSSEEVLLARLAAHPLPGNLRDLQRVAWHLVARRHAGASISDAITHALSVLGRLHAAEQHLPDPELLRARLPLDEPLPDLLTALRGRWVEAAMAEAQGNQTAAARLLKVKRETLKSWLAK